MDHASAAFVDKKIFCGFLEMETKANSGVFRRRFLRLNPDASTLEYFADRQQNEDASTAPDGIFNLCYMSMAADAASIRPKIKHCFYIVVSGQKHFFKASSDKDQENWIEQLQDASRITVPQRRSMLEANSDSGFKVEVVGGVVVRTPLELDAENGSSSDESEPRSASPSPSHFATENCIKEGYCTKQGGFRKNWKRRFFMLTSTHLVYCRSLEDRTPIRTVNVSDIMEARVSIGVHPNRENVFEVVTCQRVFYIQACSSRERDSWIQALDACIKKQFDVLHAAPSDGRTVADA